MATDFTQLRRDFKDMLTEYSNRSDGNVVYEFINPNQDEATEQKAIREGINPVLINVREKDQIKQQKAYLGAVVSYGDRREVIPLIQPGSAMEYSLTTSVKKMTVENKPVIGFVEGHGETPLNAMVQVLQALYVLYDVEPVNLADSALHLGKYKTLVIIGPKDSIPPDQLVKLDDFLALGRNIYVAFNRVEGNLQTASGTAVSTGLEEWLGQKGIRVNPDFVIDQSCGSVMVNQQQGHLTFQSSMRFPYLPVITNFAETPATKGLTNVLLQFASSIDYTGSGDLVYTPLATSSVKSGRESAPLYFDITRNWQQSDFPLSQLTVCARLSGKISGNAVSSIIVVSDADFPVNGEGRGARELQGDNLNFIVNAIDWLSDDTGLIELRSREVTARPLDPMEDGKKALIKYLNFLLPLLLIIGYGLFRWQYRRNLRIKRMNENYF